MSIHPPEFGYLLKKRGLYYNPGAAGYTGSVAGAGRFSHCEAQCHAKDAGVSFVHESELTEPSADAWGAEDILIYERGQKEWETLRHAIAHTKGISEDDYLAVMAEDYTEDLDRILDENQVHNAAFANALEHYALAKNEDHLRAHARTLRATVSLDHNDATQERVRKEASDAFDQAHYPQIALQASA